MTNWEKKVSNIIQKNGKKKKRETGEIDDIRLEKKA